MWLDRELVTLTDSVSWKVSSVIIPLIDLLVVHANSIIFDNLVVSIVILGLQVLKKLSSFVQIYLNLTVHVGVSLLLFVKLDDLLENFF